MTSDENVSTEPARAPQAALIGALAILATIAGLLMWVSMAIAPVRLVSGLSDARTHLNKAQKNLDKTQIKAAGQEAKRALGASRRAEVALGAPSPLLELARIVPRVGDMLDEVPHLVRAAVASARAATDTIDVATTLLRPGPGAIIARDPEDRTSSIIRLDKVEAVAETVARARELVGETLAELEAVDIDALPRRLRGSITDGIEKAIETENVLADAEAGFSILPRVLGADEPRIYLIGMQNSAEERGTGGAILQFALLAISEGKPTLPETRGSVYNVDEGRAQIGLDLPEDAWYVAGIPDAQRFGNSNWSPDWPLSAQVMLDYAYASDENFPQIDGFILVDPFVMEHLLPGIGKYQIKAGNRITSERVVPFVLYRSYGAFPITPIRRIILRQVVDGFYKGLLSPDHPTDLMQGMSKSLADKRMQIWMADPAEQAYIERMRWDGAIRPAEGSDYLYVVEQNVGGNKLDYFVTPTHEVDVSLVGDDAEISTKVSLHNGVFMPQPRWSMGDSGPFHLPMINVYVPGDAVLGSATTDVTRLDTPAPAVWAGVLPPEHREAGKKVWPVTLEIPPGESGSIAYDYTVPDVVRTAGGRRVYRLVVQYQPKVHPERLVVSIDLPSGAEDVRAKGAARRGDTLVWDLTMKSDLVLEVSWEE